MISLIEDATRLLLVSDHRSELEKLENVFKYRPNGYFFTPAYKEWEHSEGESGWDGWARPLKVISQHRALVDRGRRDEVLDACRLNKIDVDTQKLLPRHFKDVVLEDIPVDLLRDLTLDDHQRACILAWLKAGIGIHKVTVSGGKTALLAGAAAMIKKGDPSCRFLYVTHTERLVKQSFKEMKRFLPTWNISQYGGGTKNNEGTDMVVATLSMIRNNLKELKREEWFNTFGGILFDESHHAAAPSSQDILRAIPAYFRLGCSDSMKENNPSAYWTIVGLLGPKLNTVKFSTMAEAGRVARPTIYLVERESWRNKFEHLPNVVSPNSPAWALIKDKWVKGTYLGPVFQKNSRGTVIQETRRVFDEKAGEVVSVKENATEMGLHRIEINGRVHEIESVNCLLHRLYDQAIVRFQERNDLVVEWANWYSKRKLPTLIVCTRSIHIEILETLLIESGMAEDNIQCLYGSGQDRDGIIDWFKEAPGGPVLISSLIKEGVSINEIRAGVVADYVADYEAANQMIGRFVRPKKTGDNTAEITFFIDSQHPTMRRNSNAMFRKLNEIDGYEFIRPIIHPPSDRSAPGPRMERARGLRRL